MKVGFKLLSAGFCTNHEIMSLAGGRPLKIKFPAMVGVIEHPKAGVVLFDTGYANHFFEETRGFPGSVYAALTPVHLREEESLANQLRAQGVQPADVGLVILSHFHADHVAGAKDFPQARFVCYEQTFRSLRKLGSVHALTHAFLPGLLPADFESRVEALEQGTVVELPEQFRPFTQGIDILGDRSLVAVELPGHALGHYGVLIDTEPRPVFMVGDACWHSESYRGPRLPHWLPQHVVFSDRHRYRDTLQRLHGLHTTAGDGLLIVPSHCMEVYQAQVPGATPL